MADRKGSTTGNRLPEGGNKNTPEEAERRNSAIDAIITSQKGIPDWRNLEKKLVRRLDLTLVPMLWILYVTNYLDR
jgi:hypothetical protein